MRLVVVVVVIADNSLHAATAIWESQWPGQRWSGLAQVWIEPAQSGTSPSSGTWGGARRMKFGRNVVLATDLIRRLDVVRVGLECLRTVFWVIGRG